MLALVAVLFVATELLAQTNITAPPHEFLQLVWKFGNPFLAAGFAGAFIIHMGSRPARWEVAVTCTVGVGLELVHLYFRNRQGLPTIQLVGNVGFGLGAASIGVLTAQMARAQGRRARLSTLLAGTIVPTFVLLSFSSLVATVALHPGTKDGVLYAVDGMLGAQPSFAAGRLFAKLPSLRFVCEMVYMALPAGFAFIYAVQMRDDEPPVADILHVFLWVGAAGFITYHAFPVVGPVYAFKGHYPNLPPEGFQALSGLSFRNCMPSLHTAWALLLWWYARPYTLTVRIIAGAALALTLLATLGFGWHYAIDLVVAVPFVTAIHAACLTAVPPGSPERRRAIVWCVGLTAAWLVLLRAAPSIFLTSSVLTWALVIATLVISLWLEERLWKTATATPRKSAARPPASRPRAKLVLGGLLALGVGVVAALCYVLLGQALTTLIGNGPGATTTILVTCVTALCAGVWIGSRVKQEATSALAYCLGGIAIVLVVSPALLRGVARMYVNWATGSPPGGVTHLTLGVAAAAVVLAPAALLTGVAATLARRSALPNTTDASATAWLWGTLILGAALGIPIATVIALPALGVTKTMWAAGAVAGTVASLAYLLSTRQPPTPAAEELHPTSIVGLVAVATTGIATIAVWTAYSHLLVVTVGDSVYTRAWMHAGFLLGLGAGVWLGWAWARRHSAAGGYSLSCLLLALALLVGALAWPQIPSYLASFDGFRLTHEFGAREVVRLVVCLLMLVPVALLLGALLPLGLMMSRTPDQKPATSRVPPTITYCLGVVVGSFVAVWLLRGVGSLRFIQIIAGVAVSASAATVALKLNTETLGRRAIVASIVVAAIAALAPNSFNLARLGSGAHVQFASRATGHAVAHKENAHGLVVVARDSDRRVVLIHNGTIISATLPVEAGAAAFPLMHTQGRQRALVIGVAMGATTDALHRAGFARIDVVDANPAMFSMARSRTTTTDRRPLDAPNVQTHSADPRQFVLLTRDRYDVLTIHAPLGQRSSSTIHRREFYRLAKRRLSPGGVLQQRFRLDLLDPETLVSVLATIRSELSSVWLYGVGDEAIVVACPQPCQPREVLRAKTAGLADNLEDQRILSPGDVDRLLAEAEALIGESAHALTANDDNLLLDYRGGRGHALGNRRASSKNRRLLRRFSQAR